jgi:hypothetical protein
MAGTWAPQLIKLVYGTSRQACLLFVPLTGTWHVDLGRWPPSFHLWGVTKRESDSLSHLDKICSL